MRPGSPSSAIGSGRGATAAIPSLVGRTVRVDGEPTQVVGIAPAWLDRPGSPDALAAGAVQRRESADRQLRLERHRPAEATGVRPEQAATHLEPLVRRAMSEYIQSANYRAFLTDGKYRPLVHADERGRDRQRARAALDPARHRRHGAARRLRQRRESLSRPRGVAPARNRGADCARRQPRRPGAQAARRGASCSRPSARALGVALRRGRRAAAAPARARHDSAPRPGPRRRHRAAVRRGARPRRPRSIFGLAPAIRYTRPDVLGALRHGGRSATDHPSASAAASCSSSRRRRWRSCCSSARVCSRRSFARLMGAEQGFVARNVLTFRVALPQTTYPKSPEVARVHAAARRSALASCPASRPRGATTRAAGRERHVGHRVRVRRTAGRSRTAAADRALFDA